MRSVSNLRELRSEECKDEASVQGRELAELFRFGFVALKEPII
jgi:hypothetical protein